MSGYGEYNFESGKKYAGGMKDGHFVGKGTFSWPDGTKVESDNFEKDEVTGHGVKTWSDGSRYEGDFRRGWI